MIHVTKLNGNEIVVNADLIEFVESTPDTLISLTTGRKVMVLENLEEIVMRCLAFRRSAKSHPVPVPTDSPAFQVTDA